MPEFPDADERLTAAHRPFTLFDSLFFLIAVLASGFSGWTTYLGFSYDLPQVLATIMAVIIGVGLFMINLRLRENRIFGDSIVPTLAAFFVFFVFSFISNTNAIYTYFLERDIIGETQTAAWHNFDVGTQQILAEIDKNQISIEAARLKQALDVARANLRRQITDPANPGMGDKSKAHLEELETILGVQLTRLQPPRSSAPMADHEAFAKALDELILQTFATQFQTTRSDAQEILSFRDKIKKLRALYEEKIYQKEFSSDTTDLMRSDLDSLAVQARNLLGFQGDVPVINVSADDIGSFQYTWNNFWNGTKLPAILLSVLLSAMLDILTPVISLLLYKPETDF